MRVWQSLCLAIMLVMPAVTQAAIQQVRILGVGVDNVSTRAEEKAIDYAKKRAVFLVARKLQVEGASDRLAMLNPKTYDKIVRGVTVLNTRRNQEITYADVMVSVVDTELKRALELPVGNDLPEDVASVKRNVLVLPWYRDSVRAYLWEEKNPLASTLRSEVLRQSRGTVMMPAGDFEDLRLIDYNNAPTVSGAELLPMFKRYGADEIILVQVVVGTPQTAEPTLVTLRRLTQAGERKEEIRVTPSQAEEATELRIAAAAHAATAAIVQIASATAEEEQEVLNATAQLPVQFDFANPRELARMQQALRETPGVLALRIPAIRLQTVSGTVYLKAERAEVRTKLIKQGILVAEKSGGWVLSYR